MSTCFSLCTDGHTDDNQRFQSSVKIFLVPPTKQRVSEAASGGIRIKTCNNDTKEVFQVSTDVFNTLQEKNTKR